MFFRRSEVERAAGGRSGCPASTTRHAGRPPLRLDLDLAPQAPRDKTLEVIRSPRRPQQLGPIHFLFAAQDRSAVGENGHRAGEIELIGDVPKTVRAPFVTHTKTGLISAWLLFPVDRPYRTYSLVSYPVDMSQPAKTMKKRYAIDHPYGSLIGWSVDNPDPDRVYECRWTTD